MKTFKKKFIIKEINILLIIKSRNKKNYRNKLLDNFNNFQQNLGKIHQILQFLYLMFITK